MASIASPCPDCGHIHTAADARAVGRFRPEGALGYRANLSGMPTGSLRNTRAEAVRDACLMRQRHTGEGS